MRKLPSVYLPAGQLEGSADVYTIDVRLDTNRYVFDATFIHLARYGLSTFCTSELSTTQSAFLGEYVAAVNQEIAFKEDTLAFDQVLVDIALCIDRTDVIVCGNSNLHVYVPCGTNINL